MFSQKEFEKNKQLLFGFLFGINIETYLHHIKYNNNKLTITVPLDNTNNSSNNMQIFKYTKSKFIEAGTYGQVGTLTAPDETNPTVLPLYGKPTYPGSQHWLYYTSTDKLPTVKLPLKLNGKDCLGEPGCKEINGGENINVPAYASKEFTVDIYKMDTPRYIPIV